MRRRALLAGCTAGATAGLAGCAGLLGGGDDGGGQDQDLEPVAANGTALVPEAEVYEAAWNRTETGTETGADGRTASYRRAAEETEFRLEVTVRRFADADAAAADLQAERDRFEAYVGVTIEEVALASGGFGVSRSVQNAEVWFRDVNVVVNVALESDYFFQGGGPEVTVGDVRTLAEATRTAWRDG